MADRAVFTYQTRISIAAPTGAALDAYAALFGKAERSLFAAGMAVVATEESYTSKISPMFGDTLPISAQ